ncbi:MAG: Maf family protein [Clostridiales bacterium]|nr:Maf family protein [Clostridiales bacterium]
MRIILGSASPRRKELLERMGLEFEVIPSRGEEIITKKIPSEIVTELAEQKARAVMNERSEGKLPEPQDRPDDDLLSLAQKKKDTFQRPCTTTEDLLIIGADTVVAHGHQILGKPSDEKDAYRMLQSLSGNTHQVYTGVCLIRMRPDGCEEHCFFEKTDVTFYPMTEQEVCAYIRTGDPMDKAGAYGIQGVCGKYIREIHGDYNNVVGLPIARLYHEMKVHGFWP